MRRKLFLALFPVTFYKLPSIRSTKMFLFSTRARRRKVGEKREGCYHRSRGANFRSLFTFVARVRRLRQDLGSYANRYFIPVYGNKDRGWRVRWFSRGKFSKGYASDRGRVVGYDFLCFLMDRRVDFSITVHFPRWFPVTSERVTSIAISLSGFYYRRMLFES